jgi:tripartite-type tricarboxylate transporter receptor subunit TctC
LNIIDCLDRNLGNTLTTMPQVQAGKVRAIADSSLKRIAAAQDA